MAGELTESSKGSAGRRRTPSLAVTAVFVLAVLASALLTWVDRASYAFLFGPLNLLLLTTLSAVAGAAALWALAAFDWFRAPSTARSVLISLGLGAGLTLPVIAVDAMGAFPLELNVRFPASLLFYPSIALVAEAVFHLVPLALIGAASKLTRFERRSARLFAIGVVALVEPLLQVSFFAGQSSLATSLFLALYVLAFNLVALETFRRSGFLALYALRLGYYLVWHIAWGHVRIPLLFGGGG